MAIRLTIAAPPATWPDWYPPLDVHRPEQYTMRAAYFRLVLQVLEVIGTIESDGDFTGAPDLCGAIARDLRVLVTAGDLDEELFEWLRGAWNEFQDEMRRSVEAKGEIVLGGLEPFDYTQRSLRNDLLHFGAFNAIAADHGGYQIG